MENAKSPKDDKHPIAPQKPRLPGGAGYREAKGGVPEKQPAKQKEK